MKNNLKYIKKLLKVLIWPIIFMIGQFFIQYIFVAIFNVNEKGTMTNNEFLEYIKTKEYTNKLNNYINDQALLIVLIIMIILVPLLLMAFRKYKQKSNFKIKDIYIPILFGISISLIYNITLFNLNNVVNFTNQFELSTLPIIVQIICSGICGPILEELLFRGILYNKLKEFNKPMTSIILCSLIFGIIHSTLIDAIYAFAVSFMFIYLYEKYKTIKAPILMHISLNITVILMMNVIVKNILLLNLSLLVVSIVLLLILKKIIIKDV